MKLSTFTLLAIIGASTVLATGAPSQLDGLKEDCEEDKPKPQHHHGLKPHGHKAKHTGLEHGAPKHSGHKHGGPKHTTFKPNTPTDPDCDDDAPKTGTPLPPVDHLPTPKGSVPSNTGSVPSNTTPKPKHPKVTGPKPPCDKATTEAACSSSVISQLIG